MICTLQNHHPKKIPDQTGIIQINRGFLRASAQTSLKAKNNPDEPLKPKIKTLLSDTPNSKGGVF
jgi:hypothetical protein